MFRMRALFVTNQHKTIFYDAVARRLCKHGVEIFWISNSKRWTNYLVAQAWDRNALLSLPQFGPEWSAPFTPSPDDWARLARIEATSEVGLKNILIMDREVSKGNGLATEAYVHVVTREIDRFVERHAIRFGFGEVTWAQELLTSEVMRAHGGQFFFTHTVRVPSSRVAFFEGIYHDAIAKLGEPDEGHREIARAAIEAIRKRGEKPYYFTRNMNPYRFRRHWIDEAFRSIAKSGEAQYDHSVPRLAARVIRRLKGGASGWWMRVADTFERAPVNGARPFVLVLLHVQPESSVDVLGAPRSNQLEVIRALARILPFGWEIWVKEHPHAIGSREAHYYRSLKSLPGLRLIDPGEDTAALAQRAGVVASVSGTGCLEAAIMGVPAITFAPIVWRPILLRSDVDPFGMTHRDMADLLVEARRLRQDPNQDRRIEDFVTWLVAQSVEGFYADPVSTPEAMTPANIESIAVAKIKLMQSSSPPKRTRGSW
jgi:hypothetical protein